MITFRYHVITLVAVFLALGLGVLFGASFIDEKTVSGLEQSQRRLGDRNRSLQSQVDKSENSNNLLQASAASAKELLIKGALKDRSVIVVAFQGSPENLVAAAEQAVIEAEGNLQASFKLSEDWNLRNEEQRRRIAGVIQTPLIDAKSLNDLFIQDFSAVWSGQNPAFLQQLVDGGVTGESHPDGAHAVAPKDITLPGSAIIFVAPKGAKDLNSRLVVPLVKSVSATPVVVAVVESGLPLQVVGALRDDAAIKAVTVDAADQPLGQAGLILGLKAAFAGNFGHYGFGKGASSALPKPEALKPSPP